VAEILFVAVIVLCVFKLLKLAEGKNAKNTHQKSSNNKETIIKKEEEKRSQSYYDNLIKNMDEIWEKEGDYDEFLEKIKDLWEKEDDYYYYFRDSLKNDEAVKGYVKRTIQWMKVNDCEEPKTICAQCLFRGRTYCGASRGPDLPVPEGEICRYFRHQLSPDELVDMNGYIYGPERCLGHIPGFELGGMLLRNGTILKRDEYISENGSICKLVPGEYRNDNGTMSKIYKSSYQNHCWNCGARIDSNYCKEDPGYGYICNQCGCSLRGWK